MKKYKVFITWEDGTNDEFESEGKCNEEAETTLIDTFSGTVKDAIYTYWSDENGKG